MVDQGFYVLGVLVVAFALFLTDKVRADIVSLLVLLALGIAGVVTPEETVAGFARPSILTLAGLFVVSAALERAGVVSWVASRLSRLSGSSEPKMVGVFMLTGAALSLCMNTIAAGSLLLPAAVDVARRNQLPASRLLMPLGFGVILGGTATIFTTANIVLSGVLHDLTGRSLGFTSFVLTGGVVTLAGTAYMVFIGSRLLPSGTSSGRAALSLNDLASLYEVEKRLWEVKIVEGSPLVGQTLAEARLGAERDLSVLALWHGREAMFHPDPNYRLQVDDILLVVGDEEHAHSLEGTHVGRNRKRHPGSRDLPVLMSEVVVPPRSRAAGRSLRELRFRTRHRVTAVALWRSGRAISHDVGNQVLRAGDALLVVGKMRQILKLADDPDWLVVDTPAYGPVSASQTIWTLIVAGGVIFTAGLGLVPMAQASLAGGVALVLLGCLTPDEAYSSIEWRAIVLIAAMSPMAIALERTGWTDIVGKSLAGTLSYGPLALVAAFFLSTAALAQVLGGQVTALLAGPITIGIAIKLGLDPVGIGVLVAIACSNAFLTPVSHPVNALVMGPGGYKAKDFVKVGAGLMLVTFSAAMVMAHFYWGF